MAVAMQNNQVILLTRKLDSELECSSQHLKGSIMRANQNCVNCGIKLDIHEIAIGETCKDISCKTQFFLERDRALSARQNLEVERIRKIVNAERAAESKVTAEKALKTPFRNPVETKPDEEKVRNFKRNLKNTIRKVFESKSDCAEIGVNQQSKDNSSIPETNAALQAACATCLGYCCVHGGEHAFLTPEIMKERLAERKGETTASVYRDYIRHLPEASVEGTCVYHTANGCAISRNMRADICNSYECKDLLHIREETRRENWAPIVFVAMEETKAVNARWVSNDYNEQLLPALSAEHNEYHS